MKELIGRTITKLEVNDDSTILVFTDSNGGTVAYEAFGDCCSYSWFSDVTGLMNLLDHTVAKVVERKEVSDIKQAKAEKQGNYESLSLYGYLIKTERGTCDIEFRNDSNGYYGGWCSPIKLLSGEILREVREDKL